MKRESWIRLKALQRAGRRPAPLDKGAHIDQLRARRGMQPMFGTPARSRKPSRKAREKGR